jgi:hypothetical protein
MSLLQTESELRRCSNQLHAGHSSSLQSEVVMLGRKVANLEATQAAQNLSKLTISLCLSLWFAFCYRLKPRLAAISKRNLTLRISWHVPD